jgi:hypothetical protein
VSPPRAIAVGTGITPTISWLPPSLGTPSWYVATIDRIQITVDSGTSFVPVASLFTTQTSIDVPIGVMTHGESYVVFVEANVTPGRDLETAPFANVQTGAFASAISAAIAP